MGKVMEKERKNKKTKRNHQRRVLYIHRLECDNVETPNLLKCKEMPEIFFFIKRCVDEVTNKFVAINRFFSFNMLVFTNIIRWVYKQETRLAATPKVTI